MDKELLEKCLEMLNQAIYDSGPQGQPKLSPACRVIARRVCEDLELLRDECYFDRVK